MKGSVDKPGNANLCYREAIFFVEMLDDELRKNFLAPGFSVALIDTENLRYILVMDRLNPVVEVGDLFKALGEGTDLKTLGGEGCSAENLILGVADAAAALHARYWNDKEFFNRHAESLLHGEWLQGKSEETFNKALKAAKSYIDPVRNPEHEIHKEYPELAKYVIAALDNCSWERYRQTYAEGQDLCLLHGDLHAKQMMWKTDEQKVYCVDFEFMCIGPYATDLGNFMNMMSAELSEAYEDLFLARYHEKLIASGKVDAAVYTLEKVKQDYIDFRLPRAIILSTIMVSFASQDPFAK